MKSEMAGFKPSAWEKIKEILVVNTNPGTMGRQRKLNLAAKIFMALLPYFEDEEREKETFNDDKELGKALMNRKNIEELENSLGL